MMDGQYCFLCSLIILQRCHIYACALNLLYIDVPGVGKSQSVIPKGLNNLFYLSCLIRIIHQHSRLKPASHHSLGPGYRLLALANERWSIFRDDRLPQECIELILLDIFSCAIELLNHAMSGEASVLRVDWAEAGVLAHDYFFAGERYHGPGRH